MVFSLTAAQTRAINNTAIHWDGNCVEESLLLSTILSWVFLTRAEVTKEMGEKESVDAFMISSRPMCESIHAGVKTLKNPAPKVLNFTQD